MGETVLDQFGYKRLSRRFQTKVKSDVVAPSHVGCCEFVGGLVVSEDGGRYCFDKTFCPKRIFADSKIYADCPSRLEKLKDRKEQR